jgi:hypothetical protein
MGDTLYVVGERMNAVRCQATAPTPSDEDPLYPVTNLTSGQPGEPFSSDSLAILTIDGDLNEVPNPGMESAFVDSLPSAAWVKTAGGTITRDTSIKYAGAASLKLDPSAPGDGAYVDVQVRPGDEWVFSGAAYSGASGSQASVKVRNLKTGNWLNGSSGLWLAGNLNFLCSSTSAAWGPRVVASTIESWAACGNVPLVTLRIYVEATTDLGDDMYFDEICAWRTLTFGSIHGHNIPPYCAPVELCMGSAPSPTTVEATFDYCEGSMYAVVGDTKPLRYYRLRVSRAALEEPIWIDKLVLGQHQAMTRRQKWEQAQTLIQAQDRSDNDVGPQQAYLRSGTQRAQWSLSYSDVGEAEFAERRRIMLDSANGAWPTVIVIDSATDVSLAGRQVFLVRWSDQAFKHGRRPAVTALRDSSVMADEMPIFAGMLP